eukprot:scaffold14293_cov20-Tisochrysis_lutea.AAC.3
MEVNFKAEGTHMQADQQKSKHKGKSEHRGGDRSKSNSKAGEQGHSERMTSTDHMAKQSLVFTLHPASKHGSARQRAGSSLKRAVQDSEWSH